MASWTAARAKSHITEMKNLFLKVLHSGILEERAFWP